MNGGWPLAVVIVAVLLFGYCAYSAREGSRSFENAVEDSWTIQRCYAKGVESVALSPGDPLSPPDDDDKCVDWFYRGVIDGEETYGILP